MKILVLESSTTSAKALLFDVESGSYEMESMPFSLEGDTSRQDAEMIFQETLEVGRKLSKSRKIDAVVLSGAWHSIMLTDKDCRSKTPVYVWSNTEASPICTRLRQDSDFVKWYYSRTGCMVSAIYPAFKLLMFKDQGIDIGDNLIMGQGSYNTFRMTGERVVMDSMASGSGLMNTHTGKYDKEILEYIGIRESQLGRIIHYTETLPLVKEAAELLGIAEGIPVIVSGADGGLNQVGAGALESGVMTFSVGTSGAIRLSSDTPILPETPSTWCYRSPMKWLSGGATSGATNCIDWFKNKMFEPEITYAQIEKNFTPRRELPVFLPFLFGERSPGWDDGRKGGFFDLKPEHSRYDMYEAVMEGILFNLYQTYKILTEINGAPKKVMLSGGILHSDLWTQKCVDLFNIPMTISAVEHSSLIGGVYLGMDVLDVPMEKRKQLFKESKTVYPRLESHEDLMKRYAKYTDWYRITAKEWGK